MSTPLFSIVIPTFNRSSLFPLAVRSLLAQTFEDFEVIVSDNSSDDDTPAVVRQFKDPRVKYARTPKHFVIADSWEFARRQATGRLVIALSDDDALVDTALERFAAEASRHDADFLFSAVARYRSPSFPGSEKNTVECPPFTGSARVVTVEEFVGPLYRFQPAFDMHPSAFVFSHATADMIAGRTGRFFWTNGVEFSAWPMAAVFAKRIVYIDAPLTLLGRTGKSWGSNTQLCNPGKEAIQAFFDDVDHSRKHAPLNNFMTSNLMAEGMLMAKSLFPSEFAAFEFDEPAYLRATVTSLAQRQSLGVDVSAELREALAYAAERHPTLMAELVERPQTPRTEALKQQLRSTVGNLGVRALRRRMQTRQLAHKLARGAAHAGFWASGDDFGFSDVLGCAEFLGRHLGPRGQGRRSGAATAPPGSDPVNTATTA